MTVVYSARAWRPDAEDSPQEYQFAIDDLIPDDGAVTSFGRPSKASIERYLREQLGMGDQEFTVDLVFANDYSPPMSPH